MNLKNTLKNSESEKNIRAVISLLVLGIAFGVLLLFSNYKESIITAGMFQPFILLVFAGMALLLGLLYLVNKK